MLCTSIDCTADVFSMSRIRTLLSFLVVVSLVVAGCNRLGPDGSESDSQEEWIPLFDGESTDGWVNPYEWGEVRVESGEIRLEARETFFLVTDSIFRDFVFVGEVHVPDRESNSGFQFRSTVEPNRVYGYQAEVDPSERGLSGGLYDEGRRGWLHPPEGDEEARRRFREEHGDVFDPEEWNRYRIRAEGDSLFIWVNGVQTTAYRDTVDREGVIGLQHHGEEGKVYRFRNLRIHRLEENGG